MADGIGGILTQKVGPIPLWGWLVGGGAAVWLVASGKLGSLTGSTSTGTSAQTAAGQATAAEAGAQQAAANASGQNAGAQLQQELGLLQQLQSFNQQSVSSYQQTAQQLTNSGQGTVTLTGTPGSKGKSDIAYTAPGGSQYITIPPGTYPLAGAPVSVPGDPYGASQYPISIAGQTYYVNAANVSQSSQGQGVGGPGRRLPPLLGKGGAGVGTVPAMWRGGHKLVRAGGAGPLYPHYAMGGPRNVMQIGALAHVHPARVMAANGLVKKGQATPGQIVRVA